MENDAHREIRVVGNQVKMAKELHETIAHVQDRDDAI
jgi:hypothetical protein